MSPIKQILVSFCVKCYNQEEYIGAALDGAFSQTYRPLEIIISDDCSTDSSVEIIEQKIAEYKACRGDIPVFFNRNKKNLGNVGNWLVFGDIAHGELLVKADGDDISLPERTSKIVDAWVNNGKKAKVIDHVASNMDLQGVDIKGYRRNLGAAQAYSIECWKRFPVKGNVPPREWVGDDTIFSIRAYAIGGAGRFQLSMNDVLVRYRCGCGATTSPRKYRDVFSSHSTECILYALRDVELNEKFLEPKNVSATKVWCLRRARESELNKRLASSKKITERVCAAISLRREFGCVSLRDNVFQIMLSLPPVLIDGILNFYLRIRWRFRRM